MIDHLSVLLARSRQPLADGIRPLPRARFEPDVPSAADSTEAFDRDGVKPRRDGEEAAEASERRVTPVVRGASAEAAPSGGEGRPALEIGDPPSPSRRRDGGVEARRTVFTQPPERSEAAVVARHSSPGAGSIGGVAEEFELPRRPGASGDADFATASVDPPGSNVNDRGRAGVTATRTTPAANAPLAETAARRAISPAVREAADAEPPGASSAGTIGVVVPAPTRPASVTEGKAVEVGRLAAVSREQPEPSGPNPAVTALPAVREEGPVIRVTIGRVEVRAVAPPSRAAPLPTARPRPPTLSLGEYLAKRNEGRP